MKVLVRNLSGIEFPIEVKNLRRRGSSGSNSLTELRGSFSRPRRFAHCLSASEGVVQRLGLHAELVGHQVAVNTVEFKSAGDVLVSAGSDDQKNIFWNWSAKSRNISYYPGHPENVLQAKIMPFSDDCRVVTSCADGEVRLGQITEGGGVDTKRLGNHSGAVNKLAIEPGSPHVFYSCGKDGFVQRFDLRSNSATMHFSCSYLYENASPHETVRLKAIVIDPRNPHHFAVGGSDEFARVYDLRRCQSGTSSNLVKPVDLFCPRHLLDVDYVDITGSAYSQSSELLVSYSEELIYLFQSDMGFGPSAPSFSPETDQQEEPQVYKGHRNFRTFKAASFFGPHDEYVASGSDCGHLFIWKKRTGKLVPMIAGDRHIVNQVDPHPHMPFLATCGLEDTVKVWAPGQNDDSPLPKNDDSPQLQALGFDISEVLHAFLACDRNEKNAVDYLLEVEDANTELSMDLLPSLHYSEVCARVILLNQSLVMVMNQAFVSALRPFLSAIDHKLLLFIPERYSAIQLYSSTLPRLHEMDAADSALVAAHWLRMCGQWQPLRPQSISDSLNGLVCMDYRTYVRVINPTTGAWRDIPAPLDDDDYREGFQRKNFFVYDPVHGVWKILSIQFRDWFVLDCQILTLGDNLWRQIPDESWIIFYAVEELLPAPNAASRDGNIDRPSIPCINGTLYWTYPGVDAIIQSRLYLVTFDSSREIFQVNKCDGVNILASPVAYNESDIALVVQTPLRDGEDDLVVWVRQNNSSSVWNRISYDSRSIINKWEDCRTIMTRFTLLGSLPTGELVLIRNRRQDPYQVFLWNIWAGTIRRIIFQGLPEEFYWDGELFRLLVHQGSLVEIP